MLLLIRTLLGRRKKFFKPITSSAGRKYIQVISEESFCVVRSRIRSERDLGGHLEQLLHVAE